MSVRRLIETYQSWRNYGRPMVLATVFETLGSTYSKAGHRILIADNGDYQGLVSGGCLEGDLAERAQAVLRTGQLASVTYDLRDEADELWGLGVGCNGLIRVLLQPLHEQFGHEPFASIATVLLSAEGGAVATVVDGAAPAMQIGATWVRRAAVANATPELHARESWRDVCRWQLDNTPRQGETQLAAGCERAFKSGHSHLGEVHGSRVLYAPLARIPRVLVLGAGLDAVPIVGMAVAMGWFVTLADHRPAWLERLEFGIADSKVVVAPTRLRETLVLDGFDAILVMSHHLATDRSYLQELADIDSRYLGVLGPPGRRQRLLGGLGPLAARLEPRLHGPVGLDIGADSPESIAVSIMAELQCVLSTRRSHAGHETGLSEMAASLL